jgi:DNA-binding NtrC family response regulator
VSALPTVLAVDPDPETRRCLALALPADAWRVLYAANAEAAMQRLAEEPVRVVVVEIALPGPSGLLVLEEARRAHPHAARLVMTAAADFDAALRAINQAEVLRFLRKPVDVPTMRAAVEAGLAWSGAARDARDARAAAARRSAGLAALVADHPGLVPAAVGDDGYGIPPHRVAVLVQRLAGTPLGAILAAALPPADA